MKTTDLIPILLYHLKDGDKYGLELVEACSKCSDGQITVKQPTLYSVLKKLEKSKFISSYWQDSDIGGKRHYFKITENGLSQLETYPPLEDLVKMAITEELSNQTEEDVESNETVRDKVENILPEKKGPSPFDNFTFTTTTNLASNNSSVFDKLLFEDRNLNEAVKDSPILEQNIECDLENTEKNDANNISVNSYETEGELVELEENKNVEENVYIPEDGIRENLLDEHNEIVKTTLDQPEINEHTAPIEEKPEEKVSAGFNIFDALDFGSTEEESHVEDNPVNETEDAISPTCNEIKLSNPFFKNSKEKTLEEKTTLEINEENTKLLSTNGDVEEFGSNAQISTFMQKNIKPAQTPKTEIIKMFTEEVQVQATPITSQDDIKFQDYIDVKNDKNIKKSLRNSNRILYKIITSTLVSLFVLLSCFLITLKQGFTPIFGVFLIVTTLYVLYYSCNFIGKFKERHYTLGQDFKYNFKKKLILRLSLFLVIVITLLIINLILDVQILTLSNFGNFYGPILITSLLLIDYILAVIFYIKI